MIRVGQRCVHQVPISDHHPILVEVTSEGITCVSDEATDVESGDVDVKISMERQACTSLMESYAS